MEILREHRLLVCNESFVFRRGKSSCTDGHGSACPPVNSNCFENVEAVTSHVV